MDKLGRPVMGDDDGGGERRGARSGASAGRSTAPPTTTTTTTKATGDAAETRALAHLTRHGLALVQRNYRVAAGPRARGGEVDLILRDADGTCVFVEVRSRRGSRHGGSAASVTAVKQRRVVYAALHFLQRFGSPPACRFDVIAIDGERLEWLKAAFDAG